MKYLSIDQTLLMIIIALSSALSWYICARILLLTKIRQARRDALKRSKAVVRGHNTEKLAPFMEAFPYSARDMVFIGKGIDYLVFNGLSRWSLEEIVLLEIKSWQSRQNRNEQLIESAVTSKKVRYEIWRR